MDTIIRQNFQRKLSNLHDTIGNLEDLLDNPKFTEEDYKEFETLLNNTDKSLDDFVFKIEDR